LARVWAPGQPELQVVDEQLFWRVPIVLSLPRLGALGTVGAVTVDARTGDISLSGEDQERLINHARWLYTGAQQDKQQQHVKDVTHFLSLRGTLADDEDFDRAMEELAKACDYQPKMRIKGKRWQSWTQSTPHR
jgi:hypothetical protein